MVLNPPLTSLILLGCQAATEEPSSLSTTTGPCSFGGAGRADLPSGTSLAQPDQAFGATAWRETVQMQKVQISSTHWAFLRHKNTNWSGMACLSDCVLQWLKGSVWWTTCRTSQWATESRCSERCPSVWPRRVNSGSCALCLQYSHSFIYRVVFRHQSEPPVFLCLQDVSVAKGETHVFWQSNPLLQSTQILHHNCKSRHQQHQHCPARCPDLIHRVWTKTSKSLSRCCTRF